MTSTANPAVRETDYPRASVPKGIVNECLAVERLRDALGEFTQLDIRKKYGCTFKGGEPHVVREYSAWYRPGGDFLKPLYYSGDWSTPDLAVDALLREVPDEAKRVASNTVAAPAYDAGHEEIAEPYDGCGGD